MKKVLLGLLLLPVLSHGAIQQQRLAHNFDANENSDDTLALKPPGAVVKCGSISGNNFDSGTITVDLSAVVGGVVTWFASDVTFTATTDAVKNVNVTQPQEMRLRASGGGASIDVDCVADTNN